MKIDVTAALDHPGERYAFSLQESPVDWESPLGVAFLGDISFSGEYWSEKGSVYITGKVAATVDAQCSRCLAPVEYPLLLSVEGKFARQDGEKGLKNHSASPSPGSRLPAMAQSAIS